MRDLTNKCGEEEGTSKSRKDSTRLSYQNQTNKPEDSNLILILNGSRIFEMK